MANQITIDIGAAANDGTGDPLRTAFNYVNNNFSNVWLTGLPNSNVQFSDNRILTVNTNANLVLAPNGIAKVVSNVSIVPNMSNVLSIGGSDRRWNTIYAQYLDISNDIAFGDLTVDGNLTVTGNIIEIGNIVTDSKTIQLANTASTANAANGSGITVGANDNIATLLYNSTSNVWTTNIGLSATGNVTGNYFIGNGSQLTGLAATYGNANVATFLAAFGSNTLSTTGNVTVGNILARSVANVGNLTLTAGANAWVFGTDGILTLAGGATLKEGVALGALALGYQAGQTSQGIRTVAIGQSAGQTSQGARAVAVGLNAGSDSQGGAAVAIGAFAGATSQGTNSIILNATGANLDQTVANTFTVAPVRNDVANTAQVMFYNTTSKEITYGNVISVAGNITGGNVSTGVITLTNGATIRDTGGDAVAFGQNAGLTSQGNFAVGIGRNAGQTTQGGAAVAIGVSAGDTSQGNGAVAIGSSAGFTDQSANTVAVGVGAGQSSQGVNAVAIGNAAGSLTQGIAAVAIGTLAGRTFQANNSIIINATGANLDQTTANTFTVAPVRNDVANTAEVMFYNTTSKEITYGNTISVAGNITGGNLTVGSGTITGGNVNGSIFNGNVAFGTGTVGGSGNITGGNISAIGNITSGNLSVTGNITGNTAGFAIGYRDIPQVSFTGNATIATTDAGKHFYSTQSTSYVLTIANNASQGFQVGAAITIVNQGTGNITIAQGSGVTLYVAGNATSGNRSVATFGMATIMKVATDTWFVSGVGVA